MKTYDVHFDDYLTSDSKGFEMSMDEAVEYVQDHNGTNDSYFQDYKGGIVSVIDNETGECIYEEIIY